MKRLALGMFILATPLATAEREDLLRFTNGDQLHGAFLGIAAGPQAVWKRDDLAEPVEFKAGSLRHVVLRGGQPLKVPATVSHLGLTNGDRLPGTITSLGPETVTLETDWAGVIEVPRKHVSALAQNPLGGRVQYYGPFSAEGWRMDHPRFPDGIPDGDQDDAPDDLPGTWSHSGAAWYWDGGRGGTVLLRPDGMGDRSVLRFQMAWRKSLNLAVGFHADLAAPPPPDDDGDDRRARLRDNTHLSRVFGNSYVLQIYSNYLMLHRTSVDDEGNPRMERVHLNNNNVRLGTAGKATVEIRSNRANGNIALHIDGEFVSQWSEGGPGDRENHAFAGKGGAFGFAVQGEDCPVRISDVVVADWNGMPDSARSMELDDQDIVLMGNGTDRFSGKVVALDADGRLDFEGRHGTFRLPLDEIAEVRFARSRLAPAPDEPSDNIVVRMESVGRISGRVQAAADGVISLNSPILGDLTLPGEYAVMIEFNSSSHISDEWDADF